MVLSASRPQWLQVNWSADAFLRHRPCSQGSEPCVGVRGAAVPSGLALVLVPHTVGRVSIAIATCLANTPSSLAPDGTQSGGFFGALPRRANPRGRRETSPPREGPPIT